MEDSINEKVQKRLSRLEHSSKSLWIVNLWVLIGMVVLTVGLVAITWKTAKTIDELTGVVNQIIDYLNAGI